MLHPDKKVHVFFSRNQRYLIIASNPMAPLALSQILVPEKDEDFSYSVFIHTNLAFLLC